ncbi:MAG: hypothetical protein FWF85_03465 [Clostridiales bacterium]|nr:hypothetical protein [Clostridiales bacterium]
MKYVEAKEKIVLPEELQKDILKFFLRTSIPRKAKQKQEDKTLSEKEGQEKK